MKQHITREQWDAITEQQREKFIQCIRGEDENEGRYIGQGGCGECGSDFRPNIGELIEFLEGIVASELAIYNHGYEWEIGFGCYDHDFKQEPYDELCDALWAAAVEILNKE